MLRINWRITYPYYSYKVFLHKGPLRKIFNSHFEHKKDLFLQDFCDYINGVDYQIEASIPPIISHNVHRWLVKAPYSYFMGAFLEIGYKPKKTFLENFIINATKKNGKRVAQLTQGFVLIFLENLLKEDKSFETEMGFTFEKIQELIVTKICKKDSARYSDENGIILFYNYYKKLFMADIIGTEFIPHIYARDVGELIIPDEKTYKNSVFSWNEDEKAKANLSLFTEEFIDLQKKAAVAYNQWIKHDVESPWIFF
ncbi:MAG: hypothetical protein GF317_22985 [Candidatus Lokiarchaeota archaeon]|nr:hypothetical protein [Candidatus Lokiarchaeota archaeon]